MTRTSQMKLGSVRLGRKILQIPTEGICPSKMKNIATLYGERGGIVMFAATCAAQIEYN